MRRRQYPERHGAEPKNVTAAVILAAGASTRMGTPKQLLPLGSGTVIEQVVKTIQPVVDRTVVVVGHQAEAVRAVLAGSRACCVDNPDYCHGMVTSVQAGIRAAGDAAAFLICLGDQPGVSRQAAAAIVAAWRRSKVLLVTPSYGGRRGHPILVSRCLREEILALPAHEGLNAVTRRHAAAGKLVPVENEEILLDMDTPLDYQAFLRRHDTRERSSGSDSPDADFRA